MTINREEGKTHESSENQRKEFGIFLIIGILCSDG